MVDQWDGFKRRASLNRPLQPVATYSEPEYILEPQPEPARALPDVWRQQLQVGDVVVQEGAMMAEEAAGNAQEGAMMAEEAAGDAQEGAMAEVVVGVAQEDLPKQAVEAALEEPPPSPVRDGGLPEQPPPMRREHQTAPQQEGEDVPPPAIGADLRQALFSMRMQNGAVVTAEVRHVMDMFE
jgi:hypothetical protein